ncbi:MAG: zf-HC2 domain-containing protein [Desulfomonile tiedjei]|nr:zf-HC2 domain-containing protein [Desulfomonile tiedjei]
MNCSQFHKQISLFLDGELAEPLREALKLHLDRCPDCRRVFERMAAMNNELQSIPGPVPSRSLARRIKERVELERTRREGRELFPAWSRVPLMAMVILLAVGLGNLAGRSVTDMLNINRTEAMLDYMMPDQDGSLAEVVMTIGVEENSR